MTARGKWDRRGWAEAVCSAYLAHHINQPARSLGLLFTGLMDDRGRVRERRDDLAAMLGVSPNGITKAVIGLTKAGLLAHTPGTGRRGTVAQYCAILPNARGVQFRDPDRCAPHAYL